MTSLSRTQHAAAEARSENFPGSEPVSKTGKNDLGLASEFHRWPLPGYIWQALERRYQSIFCTEPHLRIHGSLDTHTEAWVSRQDGQIVALILFVRHGRIAKLINEVITLSQSDIDAFAHALFQHYPKLTAITMNGIDLVEPRSARHILLRQEFSEDYILTLPDTFELWMAGISSRTREKLRNYRRKIEKKYPDIHFYSMTSAEISELKIRDVIQMNRHRMQIKGRQYGMSEEDENNLIVLMRERGQLSVIEIEGEVCAGLLCTLAGRDLYMHVIAHDAAYDDFRLGYLCAASTIQAAISQRLLRIHFLWGRYDYKTQLGAIRQPLYKICLIKNWFSCLRHPVLLITYLSWQMKAMLKYWKYR